MKNFEEFKTKIEELMEEYKLVEKVIPHLQRNPDYFLLFRIRKYDIQISYADVYKNSMGTNHIAEVKKLVFGFLQQNKEFLVEYDKTCDININVSFSNNSVNYYSYY